MKYINTLLFLFFATNVFCQEHNFVVQNIKGTININSNGKATPAKLGLWLSGDEQLSLPTNAEITLVCKSEGYVTFNKAGNYNLSDYKDKCQTPKTNILTSYLKYTWEEFSKPEKSTSPDEQDQMQNVGAAVRGGSCYATVSAKMTILNYCEGSLLLSWKKNTTAALHLQVFEYPDGGAVVLDIPVTENQYELNKLADKLKKGQDYFWTIVPPGRREECARNQIQFWQKEDYDLLLKSFSAEVNAITSDKANQAFILAYLLCEKHFPAEALNYYKEAVKLAPANTQYAKALKDFKKAYLFP